MGHAAWALMLPISLCMSLQFFVSPSGNDSYSGLHSSFSGSDGPFRTIWRAQRAVRQAVLSQNQEIVVTLADGEYRITQPIIFDREDNLGQKVTYRGSGNSVIKGSVLIRGNWIPTGNAYYLDGIDSIIRNATGQEPILPYHSLYINGRRAVRARSPNEGRYYTLEGINPRSSGGQVLDGRLAFYFQNQDIDPNWYNIDDVMVVGFHSWTSSRSWISQVDVSSHIVNFTAPTHWEFGFFPAGGGRYYVENILEGLDSPGEYYLDTLLWKLYYWPFPWENISTCVVELPLLQELVIFNGNSSAPIINFALDNLVFQHSDWKISRSQGISVDGQAAAFLGMSGTITFNYLGFSNFTNLDISGTGNFALKFNISSGNSTVMGCHLWELGAGGIWAANGNHRLNIVNNYIHDGGLIFHAGAGIVAQASGYNYIGNNEIGNMFYTGISIGWSYDFSQTIYSNNRVSNNYIHDIGQGLLSDMAGIYHLGVDNYTYMTNNMIDRVNTYDYGGWGLYSDQGSTGVVWEGNIVGHTKHESFTMNYGIYVELRDNIFVSLDSGGFTLNAPNGTFPDLIIHHNIIINRKGQPYDATLTMIPPTSIWTSDNNTFLLWEVPNLFCSPSRNNSLVHYRNLSQWVSTTGKDAHSQIVSESIFQNFPGVLNMTDFRVKSGVSFNPPNISQIGLFNLSQWNRVQPAVFCPALSQVSGGFFEPFEIDPLSKHWNPVPGTTIDPGPFPDILSLTELFRSNGSSSLQFRKSGLGNPWEPSYKVLTTINYDTTVEARADILMDSNETIFSFEIRDYSPDVFQVGPFIYFKGGKISASNLPLNFTVPILSWIRVIIQYGLGIYSTGKYNVTVIDLSRKFSANFSNIPYKMPGFCSHTYLGFNSYSVVNGTSYYLDNLQLTPFYFQIPENSIQIEFPAGNSIPFNASVPVKAQTSRPDLTCGYIFRINNSIASKGPGNQYDFPRMPAGNYQIQATAITVYGEIDSNSTLVTVLAPSSSSGSSLSAGKPTNPAVSTSVYAGKSTNVTSSSGGTSAEPAAENSLNSTNIALGIGLGLGIPIFILLVSGIVLHVLHQNKTNKFESRETSQIELTHSSTSVPSYL